MKYLNLYFLLSITACSSSSITETQLDDRVASDTNKALVKNDTRLYFLGGRVVNFPGIHINDDLDSLVLKCGKRIMENTSDFMQQADDLKARKLAFQYAKKYNEIMKVNCLKEGF